MISIGMCIGEEKVTSERETQTECDCTVVVETGVFGRVSLHRC